MDIYSRIEQLMKNKQISAYRLSKETGISTGLLSQWKKRTQNPSVDKLQKIADFFGVSLDYLTGASQQKENAPITQDGRDINDDDIKFALFGGDGEITDEMYEEVKSFADFIKKREKDKRG